MTRYHKVVWSEGMALDPQHFQQWDRHFSGVIDGRVRSVCAYPWGFTELSIDADKLVNGSFSVLRCSGVLPDGLLFDSPATDPLPPSRIIGEHFSPKAESISAFLTVAAERPGELNYRLPSSSSSRATRFLSDVLSIGDDTTGHDDRDIMVARPNLQVSFDDEVSEGQTVMRLARIVRAETGGFKLDDGYVPPSLWVSASRRLTIIAGRILELLTARTAALWERTRNVPVSQASPSSADMVALLLQGTLSTYLPLVAHYVPASDAGMNGGTPAASRSSPEALYLTLAALAGALSALPLNKTYRPGALPAYDPDNLAAAFTRLEQVLVAMLREPIESNYTEIPLTTADQSTFVGRFGDGALLDVAEIYLVATGEVRVKIDELPAQLRIASPDHLPRIREGFVRGIPLQYEPRPPTGAPSSPDLEYFRILTNNQFWAGVKSEQEIAIFVPSNLNRVQFRLIAIRNRV